MSATILSHLKSMERILNKLIVTRWKKDKILTALMTDCKCRSLSLEPEDSGSFLGNIYIGKVKNIVKNINAAFIDLGGGKTGYYSLTENMVHLHTNVSFPSNLQNIRPLRQGDEIIVQVSRDAVKTKDPVLSSNLNFTGKYAVVTLGKTQIGFSSKIKDFAWKEEVKAYLQHLKDGLSGVEFGIIVRTNAKETSREAIGEEVLNLKLRMESLLSKAENRICFTLLEGAEPSYILSLRDTYAERLQTVITDDEICYENMKRYLQENQKADVAKLQFYQDPLLPLCKLYKLEAALEEALERRVWLKSGGYVVIEHTEALTVVDVNTGKYSGKKNAEDTILKINLEAAAETARQLCLRNLSGIIIVDFIDMAREEHKQQLLALLEEELRKDPVKTVLVDMTKLGLVEITRKKVRKPLYEVYGRGAQPGRS